MSMFHVELVEMTPALRARARQLAPGRPWAADDLVQDTLECAWRFRSQYLPGTNLKAWLFTILKHRLCNELRRSRRTSDQDGAYISPPKSEASQQWSAEIAEVLVRLDRIDPPSKAALLMVSWGMSYDEAAAACGAPLRTVQSRVRRARLRLGVVHSSSEAAEAA